MLSYNNHICFSTNKCYQKQYIMENKKKTEDHKNNVTGNQKQYAVVKNKVGSSKNPKQRKKL